MTPADAARELGCPLMNPTVFIALVVYFLLGEFVVALVAGGAVFFVSALIFTVFFLPALFLFLLHLLEERARGAEPAPPTVDQLLWYGNGWSLAQLLHVAIVIGAAVAAAALVGGLRLLPLSGWFVHFVALYLAFAFYTLTGGIVRPYRLQVEVDIPEPVEPDAVAADTKLARARSDVLGHAYGLISRDNRAGGLRHLEDWIGRDPAPAAAYRWFFEQMLRWERKEPALVFAQRYLSWLLKNGEDVAAVKLMLRCGLENETFRPLPEDRELAREAAERCQQDALAGRLR